jgi:hypothetical protein
MRRIMLGAALLGAVVLIVVLVRREPPTVAPPPPPAPAEEPPADLIVKGPAQTLFGHLSYTAEQNAALVEAGNLIKAGRKPTQTLPPASLATIREVHAMVQQVECAAADPSCRAYRIEVIDCLDEAGELIGIRFGKREDIPWGLYVAAMGVSVVTREPYYRTVPALVDFCQKLTVAREKFRPKRERT